MAVDNTQRLALIRERLEIALKPDSLDVADESHKHEGHAGAKTGMGHFAVTIQSPLFADKKILACHRLIYQALDDLMNTEIHALRITLKNHL